MGVGSILAPSPITTFLSVVKSVLSVSALSPITIDPVPSATLNKPIHIYWSPFASERSPIATLRSPLDLDSSPIATAPKSFAIAL